MQYGVIIAEIVESFLQHDFGFTASRTAAPPPVGAIAQAAHDRRPQSVSAPVAAILDSDLATGIHLSAVIKHAVGSSLDNAPDLSRWCAQEKSDFGSRHCNGF
ncbi:MAG: hypothetical protein R2856_24900 [Caldilineaceae bacterium]